MELLKTDLLRNALGTPLVVSTLQRTVPRLDRFLLQTSRGWLNTGMLSVALVETLGTRSGKWREIATLCMPVGNAISLVGSNWGRTRDPAWVHNLRANPEAQVTFRGFKGPMVAKELSGRRRDDMWERLVEYNPQYLVYQDSVDRQLPVLLLEKKRAA